MFVPPAPSRFASRREFLSIGSAGLLGLGLADVLRLEAAAPARRPGRATGVILVWLGGGPSTIDMWDLKPEAPAEIRGDFRPIVTNVPGLRICEHLPRLARVMHRATLVRSLHHAINAHDVGSQYLVTGNLPSTSVEHPSLGSAAARLLPGVPGVPPYFSILSGGRISGDGAGFLGASFGPFVVNGVPGNGRRRPAGLSLPDGFTLRELEDRDRLRRRFEEGFRALDHTELPARLDKYQRSALDLLRSDKVGQALDVGREPAEARGRYGDSAMGRGALAARRLIEAGVRFVTLALSNGWDTHVRNFPALREELLPPLDQTLSALLTDLAERGLLGQTIVYCVGEFGRTPKINEKDGRDHWPGAMAALLAGGGLRPGYVHGRTDRIGSEPDGDGCTPEDVAATLFERLGIGPARKVPMPGGREVALFPGGKVLHQLCES
jgi:Protein of unknown function (DUF1501)